jgi:hypothetical protein
LQEWKEKGRKNYFAEALNRKKNNLMKEEKDCREESARGKKEIMKGWKGRR